MSYCTNCKEEISDLSDRCWKCGNKLEYTKKGNKTKNIGSPWKELVVLFWSFLFGYAYYGYSWQFVLVGVILFLLIYILMFLFEFVEKSVYKELTLYIVLLSTIISIGFGSGIFLYFGTKIIPPSIHSLESFGSDKNMEKGFLYREKNLFGLKFDYSEKISEGLYSVLDYVSKIENTLHSYEESIYLEKVLPDLEEIDKSILAHEKAIYYINNNKGRSKAFFEKDFKRLFGFDFAGFEENKARLNLKYIDSISNLIDFMNKVSSEYEIILLERFDLYKLSLERLNFIKENYDLFFEEEGGVLKLNDKEEEFMNLDVLYLDMFNNFKKLREDLMLTWQEQSIKIELEANN